MTFTRALAHPPIWIAKLNLTHIGFRWCLQSVGWRHVPPGGFIASFHLVRCEYEVSKALRPMPFVARIRLLWWIALSKRSL